MIYSFLEEYHIHTHLKNSNSYVIKSNVSAFTN